MTLSSKNTTGKTTSRRRERRAYRAIHRRLTRALAELYRQPHPGERAATLTRIAELYANLATRHLPALGTTVIDPVPLDTEGQDAEGQDVEGQGAEADRLRACADLANLVAGTEAAWANGALETIAFHGPGMRRLRDGQLSQVDADALSWLWEDFGACRDRQHRADLLEGPLYHTAAPGVGDQAAALLLTIAESEREADRRSRAMTTSRARRRRLFQALPDPTLVFGLLTLAGFVLTKSIPFGLVIIGACLYVQMWTSISDRIAPDCDPADHWRGEPDPAELAKFCPACDPAHVPLVEVDLLGGWLIGRWYAFCYQAQALPRRRPRWRSWLRCKATGHRIATPGHRAAHKAGASCRPSWIWWIPPVPIVHPNVDDTGRPDDRPGVGR